MCTRRAAEAQSKSAPAGLLEKVASLGEAVGAKELNEALEVDAIELLARAGRSCAT